MKWRDLHLRFVIRMSLGIILIMIINPMRTLLIALLMTLATQAGFERTFKKWLTYWEGQPVTTMKREGTRF